MIQIWSSDRLMSVTLCFQSLCLSVRLSVRFPAFSSAV